jgi:hypothetical protein
MTLDEEFFFRCHFNLDASKLSKEEIKLLMRKFEGKMKKVSIPAKFRFKFELRSFPELSQYVTDVELDCFSKTLDLIVLDAVVDKKPIVHEWIINTLNNPGKIDFLIRQYDFEGNLLYSKLLKKMKLIGHKCNHNYGMEDNKDLQNHELMFIYNDLEIIKEQN